MEYVAGDQCQCDLWFPPVKIPLGEEMFGTSSVLVMVPSVSQFISVRAIPSRTTVDLLEGMWELLGDVGGVLRRLMWDNEAGIGQLNALTKLAAFLVSCYSFRATETT